MLGSKSSLQGVLRGGEDTTECVAYRLEDVTPTGLYGFPEDLVVASQSNYIASGLPSHILVEPSISVNRKVTVPVGGPAICVASSLPLKEHYTTTEGTGMLQADQQPTLRPWHGRALY